METAEFFLGTPHLPRIRYAVSASFVVWSVFAIRQAQRTPAPARPGFRSGDDEPPPFPFDLPRGPVSGMARPLPPQPAQQQADARELVDA